MTGQQTACGRSALLRGLLVGPHTHAQLWGGLRGGGGDPSVARGRPLWGLGAARRGGLGRARATSRKGPGSRLRGLSLLLCQHGVRASEPPDDPWFSPASPPGETRELTHRSLIITVATVIYVFESEVSWEDGAVGLRRRHYDSMCVDIGEWSPRRLANAPPSQSDAVFCDGSFENLLS